MSRFDDEIVILNNKIYTSYFARATRIVPNRRLVSVALSTPEYWGGSYARELNPSPYLLSAYKNGKITDIEYEETYRFETLRLLNRQQIFDKYAGKVLCCWEKTGQFCHRAIILRWLAEQFGDLVIGGEI